MNKEEIKKKIKRIRMPERLAGRYHKSLSPKIKRAKARFRNSGTYGKEKANQTLNYLLDEEEKKRRSHE